MEASVAEPEVQEEQPKKEGEKVYEVVSQLIRDGMKPTVAFAHYAEQHGKAAATVATAYYRKARQSEDAPTTSRPRRSKVTAAPKAKGRPRKTEATATDRLRSALRMIDQGMAELRELVPAMQDADLFAQIKQYIPKG